MARMGFQNFFQAALDSDQLTAAQARRVKSIQKVIDSDSHAAEAVRRLLIRRYERANGKIAGAIPWADILRWFLDNAGVIIALILKIIALF